MNVWRSPLGIGGIILIIIGIILIIVAIILLSTNKSVNTPWYVWFLLILGAVLGVIGVILLIIAINREKKKEKILERRKTSYTVNRDQDEYDFFE